MFINKGWGEIEKERERERGKNRNQDANLKNNNILIGAEISIL